ncbi:gliding motility-associated C-terminal domain-containing protein [Candidatus Amoebophilus asiaticus]|nr:gliding motility-associated C-terminal domain-containing protein [Candidatus Amoebophilus asiaticus]
MFPPRSHIYSQVFAIAAIALLPFSAFCQTTFWCETFDAGGGSCNNQGVGWTLNINGPGFNDVFPNDWVINSSGSCTCGFGGNKLHVSCNSGDAFCGIMGGPGCVYNAGGITAIATDKFSSSPDISTVGRTNITMTFSYMSVGEAGSDYGQVRLSDDGGGSWNDLATQYASTATCTTAIIAIPAQYENITNFRIAFRWINNDNASGADPPFSIDDIALSVSCTPPSAIVADSTNVTCFGGSDGTAQASASGGTAPYTYAWSSGPADSIATGLSAGTHTVTITDSLGCADIATVIINQPTVLTLNVTATDATCLGNDGTATVTVTGGTSPYTYSWSNSGTTDIITGLAPGNYTVTVADNNACDGISSATVNLAGGPSLSITGTNVDCFGNNNGSADLTATGGTSPYTYSWSDGSTTEDLTNINGGTYIVTVTDNNSCSTLDTITISEPVQLTASISTTDATCGLADGSATASVSGGTTPYQYDWIDGQTTANATGLSSGSYTVTVTDGNTCTVILTGNVNDLGAPSVGIFSSTNINCNGDNDGTATATVSGGTLPYTFSWNSVPPQSDSIATGLIGGNYTIQVTDSMGCISNENVTITEPDSMDLIFVRSDISCNGANDGSAIVSTSGGTNPYTYNWSNAATTANISGLGPGSYTLTVRDNNNCSTTGNITIIEPTLLNISASSTDASCGASDGTASVSVSGGVTPYQYSWSNGSTTSDISGLSSGTYTVTVVDNNNCNDITTATINNPPGSPLITILSVTDVSCFGSSEGQIVLTDTCPSPPCTYIWSPNVSNDSSASNLPAGTYTITVIDPSQCLDIETITITEPDSLVIAATTTPASCTVDDGTGTVQVTGGTTPYTYTWSNGGNTSSENGLAAGNYTVVIADSNNCKDTVSLTVNPSAIPTLNAEPDTTIKSGESVNLNANAGLSVTVLWSPPDYLSDPNSPTPIATPEQTQQYIVTVTDSNGCTNTDTITITVLDPGVIFIPDAFSPNGDGQNDLLIIRGEGIKSLLFIIFNRWGQKVFEADKVDQGWDGKFRGKDQPMDKYAYYLKAQALDGEDFERKGSITLIR